ncbi:hypothetical protein [Georgenia ruanii]|uniref:Uncharacterized protein n=1 Tax=Georgenia ruanii TaxID=348442 RepID=A0A7J9UUW0_9MICO|nr:hypothetical protein [Georgenia ruanii]MPV88387.1 hypothetical protein [Georgenia ruanii]
MAGDRRGWELRFGIWATEQQAHALLERVHRLLCPDPDHAPPCPIPWESAIGPIDHAEAGRYRALLDQVAIEDPDEVRRRT